MKTKKNLNLCGGAVALLALLPLASIASETAAEAKDPKGEPATHVLFTGTDVRVLYDGVLHRVHGVEGGSFIIKVKDKEVEIPMGTNPEKLKVARVQRLTNHSATVTNFKHERAYTPANDPQRKFLQQMQGLAAVQETTVNLDKNARMTPQTRTVRVGSGLGTLVTIRNPDFDANSATAEMAHSQSSNSMDSQFYTQRLAEEQAAQLFDALDVQFEVSSAKSIHSPYVVIMAKYHEKDDPKHPQNWLFAKALAAIDSTPRKESVTEGGFPPGFVVEKLQVHLYENGVELPTDLSENRALLTRDEAHEYLVIDYLTAHKTDTTKPQIALAKLPEGWATRPRDESFRKTYYIKVDATGHAVESFEDETCKTKVGDAYYEGILKDILFLPALQHGKPVDGVTQVKLNEVPM